MLARLRREPKAGHGFRQKLAKAMNCQLAYVSHVLGGHRDFSVDQAEALAHFLGFDSDEKEYFIYLVEWARAGTAGSKKLFAQLLERKRETYLQLKKRVNISQELNDQDKAIYYSDYIYAAVHMLVTIPKFRTLSVIAEKMNIPIERVMDVVNFLKSRGLIEEDRGHFLPTKKFLFIDRNSAFISQHHANWRLQALHNIHLRRENDLHLSMAVTLSESDALELRKLVSSFIEDVSSKIKESAEEKLMAFNIDLFEV